MPSTFICQIAARLLPESVDLIDDSSGKKALRKSKDKLFGNKFRKLLAKDSKDNRELSELLPTRKRFKSDKYASDKKDFFRTGDRSQQFFSDRALEQQIPVWGPQLQRAVQPEREMLQRNLQNCNNNYKKNRESVNQVSFLSSMSHKPIEENIPVGGRMKHFLHNWEKFSGY